ncbi:Hypothetical protein LUCI_0801 [Lucifera butyrica]|uniref:DUF1064 domain-containing protein n=1 Tax=Lucifera butyrica TaxID=1351585 RepID=A0A498R2G9_9FIRM|nr:DUF1064 domain-containing protein [Lucifera butyrica]VBB05591.1 Hypothetical protein LUCI_0801 [Lucifera butyrica]
MIQLTWNSLSEDTRRRNPHLKELLLKEQKRAKYNNNRTEVDGILFDSEKEAAKYGELKILKLVGEVVKFELQPAFLLQEGYFDQGKWVRPMVYRADFRVWYRDGRVVVIDTKGYRTKEYRLKKKLFRKKYPEIEFVEE